MEYVIRQLVVKILTSAISSQVDKETKVGKMLTEEQGLGFQLCAIIVAGLFLAVFVYGFSYFHSLLR